MSEALVLYGGGGDVIGEVGADDMLFKGGSKVRDWWGGSGLMRGSSERTLGFYHEKLQSGPSIELLVFHFAMGVSLMTRWIIMIACLEANKCKGQVPFYQAQTSRKVVDLQINTGFRHTSDVYGIHVNPEICAGPSACWRLV